MSSTTENVEQERSVTTDNFHYGLYQQISLSFGSQRLNCKCVLIIICIFHVTSHRERYLFENELKAEGNIFFTHQRMIKTFSFL